MEPNGALELFSRSMNYKIRYTRLVCDGDSKTHNLLLEHKPYGPSKLVEKLDCVGHVQKCMGTALRNLKDAHKGKKLSDGKTIGGKGRLTKVIMNSLQNYYGDAIRRNKGDLNGMIKAVQGSLLHMNSTDDAPRHHLCPVGPDSWCKYQKSLAKKLPYTHKKPPIPPAIVQLIKPIYSRLGSRSLLERCVAGFTQNANESLHSTVWQFCSKTLFQGRTGVEIGCALAVCSFNKGSVVIGDICNRLELPLSKENWTLLRKRDERRVNKSVYKCSEQGQKRRKLARKKRKGFEDAELAISGLCTQ